MKYVASKNQKAFMADLKPVYKAVSKEAAETALDELENRWGDSDLPPEGYPPFVRENPSYQAACFS